MVYSDRGDKSNQVQLVAILTAPELDTPISIARFSQEQGMAGKKTYLRGTRAQLQPVWKNYFIAVESAATSASTVLHQSRIIVIDPQGMQRVNYGSEFAPDDLVHNVMLVLARG